jgi:hypothetical protein
MAAGGLTFAAALIHASVMVTHFREYWLFGLFFALVTPLQVAFAGVVVREPGRRVLMAGLVLNTGIVVVWAVSRTVGLPFGPEALAAEPIGLKDGLATLDEVLAATLVASVLAGRVTRALEGAMAAVWVVVVVSGLAAFLASH